MMGQLYTMQPRRPAPIPKAVEHPHHGAPDQGGMPHQRGGSPTIGGQAYFRGVECIHQKWGLF